jgi:hypothetical protein
MEIKILFGKYSVDLDECNPDNFNSEIVMECMKRTNDLHTTQQCLMLLSKGAQLFPVRFLLI